MVLLTATYFGKHHVPHSQKPLIILIILTIMITIAITKYAIASYYEMDFLEVSTSGAGLSGNDTKRLFCLQLQMQIIPT